MQHNSYRRWITLAIISFSGGVSFDLAYLRYIYQIPMAKFMGFSNTEIGLIMSTFGIAAIILYAPSGVIADKFSHRKMITSAMIITGLLGLPWRSENTVLHYGHHGRYLFGDWIPAGCLRLPDYRPLARHPARSRSLPQYVADGNGGACHGDCLYLFAVPKNSYC